MKILIYLLIPILIFGNLLALDELRNLETIIIYGSNIPQFLSTDINQIFVYVFNAQQKTWHQITWQLDEKDSYGNYFGSKNHQLDANEELLIMAYDAGDWASSYYWIDDEEAKNNIRYQIEVQDPLDSAQKKYFYLYKSSTLQKDSNLPQYIQYIPSYDRVEATGYIEAHVGGIPVLWIIPESAGGAGVDILDRQKARVNGHYYIDFKITEEDGLDNPKIAYLAGPIRITRLVTFDLTFMGAKIDEMSFTKQYYPHFINSVKANKRLKKDWGISLIRQSYDLSSLAVGMEFFNPLNHWLIDGDYRNDVANQIVYLAPDYNWYLITGYQGSFVNIFQVDPIGSEYYLYYRDNKDGGTGDGTKDTGDGYSYGDIGVLIRGNNMEGTLGMPMRIYFLAANQDSIVGPTLFENFKSPLILLPQLENFASPIAATLPDTSQKRGLSISVPVFIQDVTNLNLLSADMNFTFNSTVLQATGVTTMGTLTASWGEADVDIGTDYIKLHHEGTTPLLGTGKLIYLDFKIIGEQGTQSFIHINDMTFNNEAIVATGPDGSITALAPPEITITLPDTSQEKGLSISIPVQISDVSSLDITSLQFNLNYDKSILDIIGTSITNTIATAWNEPSHMEHADGITMFMSGNTPLKGAGELVYINFDVIGDPGQTTTLSFNTIIFNEGYFNAIPQHGSFLTLTPPEVVVSIPDTTGEQRSIIQIPVYVGDVTDLNVTSIELELSFNNSVLNAIGATLVGTLCASWSALEWTDNINGINLSFSGSVPLSGSGRLVSIEFNVLGKVDETTSINISHIQFNKGNPGATTDGGLFTVVPARIDVSLPTLSGASGATISVPVSVENLTGLDVLSLNMMISYDPQILDAVAVRKKGTLTNPWGIPSFNDFSNRAHITHSGTQPLQGSGTLIYIDFHIIGPDGSSSPLHFINMIFNSGNPIAVKHDGLFTVKGEIPRVAVTIPDTFAYEGQSIKLPILVDDLTGLDVRSVNIKLSFDSTVLDATGVTTDGTLFSQLDDLLVKDAVGNIDITLVNITKLERKGVLVYVDFNVIGDAGAVTMIHFEDIMFNVFFNEGVPIAIADDGVFQVMKIPEIVVSLPDTNGMSGTSISIPIFVSDLSDGNILYWNTSISFNSQAVDATGITTTGTLSAIWDQGEFNDFDDHVQIVMQGETPLTGAGTLVYIDFNIIGADSAGTPLHFVNFIFNSGIPIALKTDGYFTIKGVIPVELASFEGVIEGNNVNLVWTTMSESNNYGFEVQRASHDEKNSPLWIPIGFVPGKGTISTAQVYNFYDKDISSGLYYYRLKQIDYNGTFSFSKIISITIIEPKAIYLSQNYPNPFSTKGRSSNANTVIKYQIPQDNFVELKVYNLLGNEVYTLIKKKQLAGSYSIEWHGDDDQGKPLPAGIYFYRLYVGGRSISKKIILVE